MSTPYLICTEVAVEINVKVFPDQAGKTPMVPRIIREMKDDKKDNIGDKAAKRQTAA
jgi:hypothetical protein